MPSEDLAAAELFRIGFCWWLERYYELLRQLWEFDELAVKPGGGREVTQLPNSVKTWSTYDLVRFIRRFRRINTHFVAECIDEAKQAQLQLAAAISPPGTPSDLAA